MCFYVKNAIDQYKNSLYLLIMQSKIKMCLSINMMPRNEISYCLLYHYCFYLKFVRNEVLIIDKFHFL